MEIYVFDEPSYGICSTTGVKNITKCVDELYR